MRWGEKIWWNNQNIFKWIPRKRTANMRQKQYSSLSICRLKTLVLWRKNPNIINEGECKVIAYETLERQTKKIPLRPSPPKPDLRVWCCHPKGNNGCQKAGEPLMTNPQILPRGNQCGLSSCSRVYSFRTGRVASSWDTRLWAVGTEMSGQKGSERWFWGLCHKVLYFLLHHIGQNPDI